MPPLLNRLLILRRFHAFLAATTAARVFAIFHATLRCHAIDPADADAAYAAAVFARR
jgi:hypothetical protein